MNLYPSLSDSKDDCLKSCGEDTSITRSLTMKKQRLERELKDVTDALDALVANPELTKVLELVNKARR